MSLFIGLDMSLAKTAVCAITEHGKIVKEAQVASDQRPWRDMCWRWAERLQR